MGDEKTAFQSDGIALLKLCIINLKQVNSILEVNIMIILIKLEIKKTSIIKASMS